MNTYTYKTSINSISLSFNTLQCNKISAYLQVYIYTSQFSIQKFTILHLNISIYPIFVCNLNTYL